MVPESCSGPGSLFLGGDDVKGQHRENRSVHGHGNGDAIQGNGVEEDFHVLDRIDGDAGLAHVGHGAGVVGIVAAMGGEIEGDGKPLLAGGDVAAIKGVALLGGGEAGVLADGPRFGDVHGAIGAAHIGGESRHGVQMLAGGEIRRGVNRAEVNAFQGLLQALVERLAHVRLEAGAPILEAGGGGGGVKRNFGKIRESIHNSMPSLA